MSFSPSNASCSPTNTSNEQTAAILSLGWWMASSAATCHHVVGRGDRLRAAADCLVHRGDRVGDGADVTLSGTARKNAKKAYINTQARIHGPKVRSSVCVCVCFSGSE